MKNKYYLQEFVHLVGLSTDWLVPPSTWTVLKTKTVSFSDTLVNICTYTTLLGVVLEGTCVCVCVCVCVYLRQLWCANFTSRSLV